MMSPATRRTKGTGGLHQRKDGYWVGVVELPRRPDGTRHRKEVVRKRKADVISAVAALKKELATTGHLATSVPTLAAYLTRWLEEVVRVKRRPKTVAGYESLIRLHIIPSIGAVRLDRVDRATVRTMKATILAKTDARTGRPLSSTTARYAYAVLRAALEDAVKDRLIAYNPAAAEDAPAKAHHEALTLSAEQSKRLLLHHASDERIALRLALAFLTGLRMGEILGLTRGQVDLEARVIRVRYQLQRIPKGGRIPAGTEGHQVKGGLWLVGPKTESGKRVVPLREGLAAMLAVRLAEMPPEPLALVVVDADGGPVDPRAYQREWVKQLADAGVPAITPHGSRHSTATVLRDRGAPERVIQMILGHSSVLTTEGYAHVADPELVQAMRLLDDVPEIGA